MDSKFAHYVPLPYELGQEINIKLEEGLYDQALSFLKELLSTGQRKEGPIYLPNREHLVTISTLAVHPSFTNRAKDSAAKSVSVTALDYLRSLNSVVEGPVAVGFSEAYFCHPFAQASGRTLRRRHEEEKDNENVGVKGDIIADEGQTGELRSPFATDKSVWSVQDFWALVGWAFRCSLLHPTRWKQAWLPWLRHVIDVIDKDWESKRTGSEGRRMTSLIATYVSGPDSGARILRALFADGKDRSAGEFKEIWKNEAAPYRPPKAKDRRKGQKLDIEHGTFGDYLDPSSQEEEEGKEDQASQQQEDFCNTSAAHEATAVYGGFEATKLRMHLLGLVARLRDDMPHVYGDTDRLFNLASDYLRPLPLDAFLSFLSPWSIGRFFPNHLYVSFLRYITHMLMQSASKAQRVPRLTQSSLVADYLPYAANTNLIVDNAKLSICLEFLFQILQNTKERDDQGLKWTQELDDAVEKGIAARHAKATKSKGIKGEASGSTDEADDRMALSMSALRLKKLLDLMRKKSESSN